MSDKHEDQKDEETSEESDQQNQAESGSKANGEGDDQQDQGEGEASAEQTDSDEGSGGDPDVNQALYGEPAEVDEEVDAEEARLLAGRNKVRVLDTREKDEVAKGTIPSAMWSTEEKLVDMAKYILRGDDIPILLIAESNSKGSDLVQKLKDEDIQATYLKGGFSSWEAKGYPQDPREDAEYDGPDISMPGTGGSMGGDESSEEAKIKVATKYREGQEEKTGTNPLDARAETAVDQRDLEISKEFERDPDVQERKLLKSSDEEGENQESDDPEGAESSESDETATIEDSAKEADGEDSSSSEKG